MAHSVISAVIALVAFALGWVVGEGIKAILGTKNRD